jgi:hypothetical protein
MNVRALLLGLVTAALLPWTLQAQKPPAITIAVEGGAPLTLTLDDLKKFPVQSVEAVDVREEIRYEGAAVVDILKKAGMSFGQTMRGDALQAYLVAESSDGYKVVYALPEVDPQFTDAVTIVAYQRSGKPLGDLDGSFRLVHSGDKRHARWARKLAGLKVQRAP